MNDKKLKMRAFECCTDPTQNPGAAGQNHAGTLAEDTASLASVAVSLACPAVADAARSQGRFDAQSELCY